MSQTRTRKRTAGTSAPAADVPTRGRPRLDDQTVDRILEFALEQPRSGQDSVARQMRECGVPVSASGVRQVLQRHGLQTRERRLAWIESRTRAAPGDTSAAPIAAVRRMPADAPPSDAATADSRPADRSPGRAAHILAVAARLIRERGFDSLSLRDIAEAAGVPAGSMYYHFPTKESLFTSVYEEGIRRLRRSVDEALDRESDPWDRLEKACATHLANLCGGDDFTAVSIPTRVPALSEPARQALVALNDRYEDVFRELVAALQLRRGVSETLLRLQLLGALNWTSVWFRPGLTSTPAIARHFVQALRAGTESTQAGKGAPILPATGFKAQE